MTGKTPALFQWKPLSDKQRSVMNWWMPESGVSDYDGIILDGSIRAGKTLPESVSFIDWGMQTYNNETLGMAGKTLGALRRNVIGPLKRVLPGRGYKIKDNRSAEEPHLEISKGRRVNKFYLFGGNNERSQDPVLGFTGGGFYFDQVELMPRSFVETAEGRCSLEDAKLWYNCNPQGANHWFYLDYLQKLEEKQLLHLHFLMDDNLSLSAKTRARYERRWPKGSVFYNRNILGRWVMAEGRVFSFFSDDPHAGYVVDRVPDHFVEYLVSLDYGISNPFIAQLWGLSGGCWYILNEFNWDSAKEQKQKSNPDYIEDMARLINWNGKPVFPKKILVPPEENGFIRDLKRAGQTRPNLIGAHAADNSIMPGIEDVTTILSLGKCKIYRHNCPVTIRSINELLWDPKAQAQGKDMYLKGGTGAADHGSDAFRYGARYAAKVLRQMGQIL